MAIEIPDGDLIAVDTETTGLNYWNGDAPFAIGFCNEKGETSTVEWDVDPFTRAVQYKPKDIRQLRLWFKKKLRRVWHYGRFDRNMLKCAMDIDVRGRNEDTKSAVHSVTTLEPSYGLKQLSDKYLDIPPDDLNALKDATRAARAYGRRMGWKLFKKKNRGKETVEPDYWTVRAHNPKSTLLRKYLETDVIRTMLMWLLCDQEMFDVNSRATYEMEIKLDKVCWKMERAGVYFDPEECQRQWDACEADQKEAITRLRKFTGRKDFNPYSTEDLRWLAYEKLNLKVLRRTKKKGDPAVDAKTLVSYSHHQPIADVFRYKIAKKGQTAFFDNYQRLKVKDELTNGFAVHATINQAGQRTGRFSYSDPNLQQVPDAISTRGARPIQGRSPFGPRPGYVWYHFDYSQLEVRVFADVSQERVLLDALDRGRDIHTECANKAWGGKGNPAGIKAAINALGMDGITVGGHDVAGDLAEMRKITDKYGFRPEKTSYDRMRWIANDWLSKFDYDIVLAEASIGKKNTRAKAKMVFFDLIFGGGPKAIMDLMYCSFEQAKEFLDDYKRAMPDIPRFVWKKTREAREKGYVETRFGRRLDVPSDKPYKGCNYTVQGSAADLIKRAMIKCDRYLIDNKIDGRMVLTIHDELIFEIKEARRKWISDIKSIMEDHEGAFSIPMPVEVARARTRWTEKEKIEWMH